MTAPTESPSAEADVPPLARIEERLAELVDLFRRRLLDDRDKRRLIDAVTDRAQAAESGPFRQYLHPLVVGLAMVVDRLDAYRGADPDFAASVRDELLDVLARQGVVPVATDGPIDPSRHDVLAVTGPLGTGRDMVVAQVEGRGYRHADWVFRPARVIATARADDEPAG